jgi:hypothetical protein
MASIGGISLYWLTGILHPAERPSGSIAPEPGVAGSAEALGAWACEPEPVTTAIDISGFTAMMLKIEALRRLHSQTVLVVDQFGRNWDSCIIKRVRSEPSSIIGNLYRIHSSWLLLPMWSPA